MRYKCQDCDATFRAEDDAERDDLRCPKCGGQLSPTQDESTPAPKPERKPRQGPVRSNAQAWIVGGIVTVVGVTLMVLFFGPDMSSRSDTGKPSAPTAEVGEQSRTKPSPRKALAETYECTPLHMAALEGDLDKARSLLAQGADANARNKGGATPLWYAQATRQHDIAQFLRNNGAFPQGSTPGYYNIFIKGTIGGNCTAERFEEQVSNATKIAPVGVLLHIDTTGGLIDHAEKMVQTIANAKHLHFIAVVDKAVSAGVPIALACKEVYIREGAIIGGAVSYIPDERGLPVQLPEDVAEKMQSVWRAVCRTAAEYGGHSPLIPEAMTDLDFSLTMREENGRVVLERDGSGDLVKAKGKVLTLTASEAVRCGLAKAVLPKAGGLQKYLGATAGVPFVRVPLIGPALHRAVIENDLPLIKALVGKADVNAIDRYGRSALHLAAFYKNMEVTRLLVAQGADVNRRAQSKPISAYRRTEFEESVLGGKNSPEFEIGIGDGATPLHAAVKLCWLGEIAKGRSNSVDVVKFLLSKGAKANARSSSGYTPLQLAVQLAVRNKEMIALLIDHGADVNASGSLGQTPLHVFMSNAPSTFLPKLPGALISNETMAMEVWQLLIRHGADVNACDDSQATPLHCAAKQGAAWAVSLLIEQGAIVGAKTKRGATPLHCAAGSFSPKKAVGLLIEHGAIVNARTVDGCTPLHEISLASPGLNQRAAAELLIAKGANVNAKTTDGVTPLLMAVGRGRGWAVPTLYSEYPHMAEHVRSLAGLLLESGADANATTKDGQTSLHFAARAGTESIADLLLKHGAKVNATDKGRRTPLWWALRERRSQVAEVLRRHGGTY